MQDCNRENKCFRLPLFFFTRWSTSRILLADTLYFPWFQMIPDDSWFFLPVTCFLKADKKLIVKHTVHWLPRHVSTGPMKLEIITLCRPLDQYELILSGKSKAPWTIPDSTRLKDSFKPLNISFLGQRESRASFDSEGELKPNWYTSETCV